MRETVIVEKVTEYPGHKGSIFAIELSPDEKFLFSSGDDGTVAKWNLDEKNPSGEGVLKVPHGIYSLAYIPNKQMLVAGGSEGSVYFIDLLQKQIIHQYRKTVDAIFDLHFSAEKNQLWVLHGKGGLSLIDLDKFETLFYKRLTDSHLRSIVSHPNESGWLVASSDQMIRWLDAEGNTILKEWEAHENSVFSLMVHKEGKYLMSGGRDAHLNIWDINQDFSLIKSIPAHNFTINDMAFSQSGDYFVTASRDKTIKLWDAYSFDLLKVIDVKRNEGHTHSVNKIKWLKSDNSLISCSDDRRIIRWNIVIEV